MSPFFRINIFETLVVCCIFVVVCAIFIGIFLISNQGKKSEEELMQIRLEKKIERFENLLESIKYFKDPRTEICYAHMWSGMASGGPGFTVVP